MRQKWSIEKLQEEALKYKYRNDFKKGSPKAYDRARKLNLLDRLCSHMKSQRETWTLDKIQAAALPFNRRIDFQHEHPKAYDAARHNVLDKVCEHMVSERTQWSEELAAKEALKYNSKIAFKDHSLMAYRYACKQKIIDKICSHMTECRTQWDIDLIKAEAKNYKTRSEFHLKSPSAYNAANKSGILEDVCSDMDKPGSLKERLIYVILFYEEQAFYVGLTYNLNGRMTSHTKKSSNSYVRELMKRDALYEVLEVMKSVPMERAGHFEESFRQKYLEKGYRCLNIVKTGALGSSKIIWTKEKVMEEAKMYNSRTDFRDGSPGAYDAALDFGIQEDACAHMALKMRRWTVDTILNEAKTYKSLKELLKKNRSLYMAAWRRGINKQFMR